jgi:hypothetical protein
VLTGEHGWWEGTESYDGEKAWLSIINNILSDLSFLPDATVALCTVEFLYFRNKLRGFLKYTVG